MLVDPSTVTFWKMTLNVYASMCSGWLRTLICEQVHFLYQHALGYFGLRSHRNLADAILFAGCFFWTHVQDVFSHVRMTKLSLVRGVAWGSKKEQESKGNDKSFV